MSRDTIGLVPPDFGEPRATAMSEATAAMMGQGVRIPPPAAPSESLIDSLVGDVVGGIAMFREPHCGGFVEMTDDQIKDRAANIVAGLLGNYRITKLDDKPARRAPSRGRR